MSSEGLFIFFLCLPWLFREVRKLLRQEEMFDFFWCKTSIDVNKCRGLSVIVANNKKI
jgi:hypothetical protein